MRANRKNPIRKSQRRGATAVEFAIVAPVIFLLFLGSIELTRLNMIRHTATHAAYEGARHAIVVGGTADDARDEVLRQLNLARVGNGADVQVDLWPDRVEVAVAIPVHLNSWGLSRFSRGMTITQHCTLKREMLDHSL